MAKKDFGGQAKLFLSDTSDTNTIDTSDTTHINEIINTQKVSDTIKYDDTIGTSDTIGTIGTIDTKAVTDIYKILLRLDSKIADDVKLYIKVSGVDSINSALQELILKGLEGSVDKIRVYKKLFTK